MKYLFAASAAAAVMAISASAANAASVVGAHEIIITNALPDWLQVAEVVADDFSAVDVSSAAQGATATASSVYPDGQNATPDHAIDGDLSGVYPDIFHSGTPNAGEFLDITLNGVATLASLTIYGRTDCCVPRDLYNYQILNSDGGVITSGQLDARDSNSASVFFTAPSGTPEPMTWALMLVGFGGAGAALRRRRAAAFAAA